MFPLKGFFESIAQVTDFGMSRFVPERMSAVAAPTSYTPPAAPLSSSVLSNASMPAFVTSAPSSAEVEAGGETPDSGNPFSTPPDACGSGRSRADLGQADAFDGTSAHAATEEGPGGGGEGRDSGTVAGGRTKRSAGIGDGRDDGGSWGLRGAARWGRSSWARGMGATPVGSSAGSSGSAAGDDEGKGELGLTTNLGTVAWAAPEMLVGDGSRGEYTAKVGGVRSVMCSWFVRGRGCRSVGKRCLTLAETVCGRTRFVGNRGRRYRPTLFYSRPSVAVPAISVSGEEFTRLRLLNLDTVPCLDIV